MLAILPCLKFHVRPVKGEAFPIRRITYFPGLGSGSNTRDLIPKLGGRDPTQVRNLVLLREGYRVSFFAIPAIF